MHFLPGWKGTVWLHIWNRWLRMSCHVDVAECDEHDWVFSQWNHQRLRLLPPPNDHTQFLSHRDIFTVSGFPFRFHIYFTDASSDAFKLEVQIYKI